MPILNYTTSIPAARTAGEVQAMLGQHGASRIATDYRGGQVSGMSFEIDTEFGPRTFRLPVRADGVLTALKDDPRVPASKATEEQARRVAWRIAKDWLEAQIALIDAGLATLDEVMLPWMLDGSEATLFETYRARAQIEVR